MSEATIARLREEANELLARGRYKRAYQRYQELRAADPANPDWALRVGELAVSLGEVEVAIDSYRAAAEGYARRGQLVKAIAACKYVLDLDPSRTDIQASLAELFARNAASPPRPRRGARPLPVPPPAYAPPPPPPPPAAYEPPPVHQPPPAYEAPQAYAPPPTYEPPPAPEPPPANHETSVPPPPAYELPPAAFDPAAYAEPSAPAEPPALPPLPPAPPIPPAPPLAPDAPLETFRLRDSLLTRAPDPGESEPADQVIVELDEDVSIEEAAASIELQLSGVAPAPVLPPPPPGEVGAASDPVPGHDEALAVLPRVPLFSSLPRAALEELIGKLRVEKRKPGEAVIREGAPGDSLYVVVSGLVEVTRGHASNVLARLGEGSFFGELALVTAEPRTATVTVVEPAELLVLSRAVMNQLIATYPEVLKTILSFVRGRLVATLLASSPLFQLFDPEDRKVLASEFELRELEVGAILVREGQRADALHVLLAGEVAMERAGRDEPVGWLGAGEVCGEQSLLGTQATATLRVERRTWSLALPRSRFQEVVLARPQMLEYLAELAEQRRAELAGGEQGGGGGRLPV